MNETTHPDTTAPVDTRDMVVVHTALLREVRRAPTAVVRSADRRRTAKHLRLVLDLLDHHHHGEDELLLPLLRARVPRSAAGALDTGEEQHARIERCIADARADVAAWAGGDQEVAARLVASLTALHTELEPHLRGEERDVLPLAARYLTEAEWRAIGDAGFRSTPKSALLTVFGMFMDEGDPEVLRAMLACAPALPRAVVPRLAPFAYARHCRRVYGTPRPGGAPGLSTSSAGRRSA